MVDIYDIMANLNEHAYYELNNRMWKKYGEELNYNNYIDFDRAIREELRSMKLTRITKGKKD